MAYAKGRRFEYEVKAYLESLGYTIFRFAGSKPLDLLALRDGKILFCECKASPKTNTKDMGEWASKLGFPVALCQKTRGSFKIEVFEPKTRRTWRNIYELLEDFLQFLLDNYASEFPNGDVWLNFERLDWAKAIWGFIYGL